MNDSTSNQSENKELMRGYAEGIRARVEQLKADPNAAAPATKAADPNAPEIPEKLPDPHGMRFAPEERKALNNFDNEAAVALAFATATPAKKELLGTKPEEEEGE